MPKDLKTRFFNKVNIIDDSKSCWEWTASRDKDGYGRIGVNGKVQRAHRVCWEMHNGPIPDGLVVMHRCDNEPCVRPDHLRLGTAQENNDDKEKKNRQVRGENNGMRKLSEPEIIEIRELADKGRTHKEIAALFAVDRSTISRIVGKKRWNHVGEYADWYKKPKRKGLGDRE